MRKLLLLCGILLAMSSVTRAQYPLMPATEDYEFIAYLDFGGGSYSFEVGISGSPVNNWSAGLFARGYPGPSGSLYNMDSPFLIGGKAKYYGIMSEGFFAGPLLAGQIFSPFRPVVGATWGYDYYKPWSEKSLFNDFRIGFELQGGIDTEGEGFIGIGINIGIGYQEILY